eukprot:TRINITY_DN17313_c0_g1_i1.p1 TRINITY_DN17313_c0_g1~~TRINITY_DN17313_c0_g1_i1.p1  ORF type:complete len:447 (+),score=140.44 TRINITY_DN17313_c0_g1_i1:97-1341(+)
MHGGGSQPPATGSPAVGPAAPGEGADAAAPGAGEGAAPSKRRRGGSEEGGSPPPAAGPGAEANRRGMALFQKGENAAALQQFDAAVEQAQGAGDPAISSYLSNRCACLIQLGRAEAAFADAERVVALKPRSAKALGWRAQCELKLGRYADAERTCAAGLQTAKAGSAVRHQLEEVGRAAVRMQQLQGKAARAELPHAGAPSGGAATAESARAEGNELFRARKYADAEVRYTCSLALNPNEHEVYANRSAARCKLFDFEGALSDADRCVALAPEWPKGHGRRADALFGLGRYEEAAGACRTGAALPGGAELLAGTLAQCEEELRWPPAVREQMHRQRVLQRQRQQTTAAIAQAGERLPALKDTPLLNPALAGPKLTEQEMRAAAVKACAAAQAAPDGAAAAAADAAGGAPAAAHG